MSTYGLSVLGADLKSLAQTAQAADAAGFDAVWASEFYSRSGSISMAAMANSTQNCRIGSSILYGVGRSPLVLATEARDLDELSNGRLVLGIGNGTKRMMGDWHGVPDTWRSLCSGLRGPRRDLSFVTHARRSSERVPP